jgi:hypothetical protein
LRNCGKIFSANARYDLAILHPLFSIRLGCGFAAPRRWRWNSRPGLESEKLRNEPKAIPADLIQMQWVPAVWLVFLPPKKNPKVPGSWDRPSSSTRCAVKGTVANRQNSR